MKQPAIVFEDWIDKLLTFQIEFKNMNFDEVYNHIPKEISSKIVEKLTGYVKV